MEINVVTLHKVVENNGAANAVRNQTERRLAGGVNVCIFYRLHNIMK